MYAIIETGGKQYKVQQGEELNIEKLDAQQGDTVVFDQVLLVVKDDEVMTGQPVVENAKVTAKVVEHGRGKKLIVFKYKPKKNYRKKQGHRQPYTRVVIENIEA